MTKQQARATITQVEKQLKKLSPELWNMVSFDVIDDANGTHDNRSYAYPLKTYNQTWIYINLREITCFDDLLHSIAHELCHALCINYEHYNDVIIKLLPNNAQAAMKELHNQAAEAFVVLAEPFMLHWLRSFCTNGKKGKE